MKNRSHYSTGLRQERRLPEGYSRLTYSRRRRPAAISNMGRNDNGFRLCSSRAYERALGRVGNPSDAEDIAQDAFVKAFDLRRSQTIPQSFEAWIMKVAENLAKNQVRWRRLREKRLLFLDAPGPDGGPAMQVSEDRAETIPHRFAEKKLEKEMLWKAVQILPRQQRTAVRLKFEDGYTATEIARLMKLAAGTVKCHLFRAVKRLRNILGENPDGL